MNQDSAGEETKSCSYKAAFLTQKEAEAAKTVNSFRHDGPVGLRPYVCSECGLFHLARQHHD